MIFSARARDFTERVPADRLSAAGFLRRPAYSLLAIRRFGEPGLDVQRRKPSTRDWIVPESQGTNSRDSYLDCAGIGNLVLVCVAHGQHGLVVDAGARRRRYRRHVCSHSRAHGSYRLAVCIRLVSVHATRFADGDLPRSECQRRASHSTWMGKSLQ